MKPILPALLGSALICHPAYAQDDTLLQAIGFVTGYEAQSVSVVDRKSCIFRAGPNTYYFNNVYVDRITFRHFTRPVLGDYTNVDIHGKGKVIDRVSHDQTFPQADYRWWQQTSRSD